MAMVNSSIARGKSPFLMNASPLSKWNDALGVGVGVRFEPEFPAVSPEDSVSNGLIGGVMLGVAIGAATWTGCSSLLGPPPPLTTTITTTIAVAAATAPAPANQADLAEDKMPLPR